MSAENVEQPILEPGEDKVLEFTPLTENVWQEELKGLPASESSKMQKRYPTTPEGMATFLRTLYPRHYLQVQESLSETIHLPWMEKAVRQGEINIIDIGSGPAVASLAINPTGGSLLSHGADMAMYQDRSLIRVLPTEYRRAHYERIMHLSERSGLQVHICGCKNSDITNERCLIAGPLPRTLFD